MLDVDAGAQLASMKGRTESIQVSHQRKMVVDLLTTRKGPRRLRSRKKVPIHFQSRCCSSGDCMRYKGFERSKTGPSNRLDRNLSTKRCWRFRTSGADYSDRHGRSSHARFGVFAATNGLEKHAIRVNSIFPYSDVEPDIGSRWTNSSLRS